MVPPREWVLEIIQKLVGFHLPSRVCVTSRPEADICDYVGYIVYSRCRSPNPAEWRSRGHLHKRLLDPVDVSIAIWTLGRHPSLASEWRSHGNP